MKSKVYEFNVPTYVSKCKLKHIAHICWQNILSKYSYRLCQYVQTVFDFLNSLPLSSQEAYVFNVFQFMRAIIEKSNNNIVQNGIMKKYLISKVWMGCGRFSEFKQCPVL